MKNALIFVFFLVPVNISAQGLRFESKSAIKFPDFAVISNLSTEYFQSKRRFCYAFGPMFQHRYSILDHDTFFENSSTFSFGLGTNLSLNLITKNKLSISWVNELRFFWNFYAYRIDRYDSGEEVIYFKNVISWNAVKIQYANTLQIEVNLLEELKFKSHLGILMDNFNQFSFNFSDKINLSPIIGFGISYQIPLSNNENKKE